MRVAIVCSILFLAVACARPHVVDRSARTETPLPQLTPNPVSVPHWPRRIEETCPDFSTPPELRRRVIAENGNLRGIVSTDSYAKPARGALVLIDSVAPPPFIETNDSGVFVLHHVSDGAHAIRVWQMGYMPMIDTLIVGPTGVSSIDYELRTVKLERMGEVCVRWEPERKPSQ